MFVYGLAVLPSDKRFYLYYFLNHQFVNQNRVYDQFEAVLCATYIIAQKFKDDAQKPRSSLPTDFPAAFKSKIEKKTLSDADRESLVSLVEKDMAVTHASPPPLSLAQVTDEEFVKNMSALHKFMVMHRVKVLLYYHSFC